MATTRERLHELAPEAPPRPPAATDPPVAPVARTPLWRRLQEPISPRQALTAAVAWAAGLTIGMAVEPPATNPEAVDPWFVSALATILLLALVTTLAGLWQRRRWSMAASLLASGLLVVSTVMCPVSGHHTNVGAWWVVQLGCGLGLLAVSALGLRQAEPR
jgi:peptidoglycan/LPS O-acetylase OafA/YrhL